MDGATIWAVVVAVAILLGLALASPLYWSRRRTQRLEDPAARASVERVEEEMWRQQRNHPGGGPFTF